MRKNLLRLDHQQKGVGTWFADAHPISLAVVRTEFASLDEAMRAAYETVSGVCDTYSILQVEPISISAMLGTREGGEPDAQVSCFFDTHAHIKWDVPDGAETRWNDRNLALVEKLLPCFDLAIGTSSSTVLGDQLRLSLKMYRHGAAATAIGIEFLCKMSALEGVVCGSERNQKQKLLKERISSLIRDSTDWNAEMEALWTLRCGASHKSAAFSEIFGTAVALVDFIFVAVMTFAADHCDTVQAVSDLWRRAPGYQLPATALLKHEGNRGRGSFAKMETTLKWPSAGVIIDAHFREFSGKT